MSHEHIFEKKRYVGISVIATWEACSCGVERNRKVEGLKDYLKPPIIPFSGVNLDGFRTALITQLKEKKIDYDIDRDETIPILANKHATGLVLAVEKVQSDYFHGEMYSANYYEHDDEGNHDGSVKTRLSTDLEDAIAWAEETRHCPECGSAEIEEDPGAGGYMQCNSCGGSWR